MENKDSDRRIKFSIGYLIVGVLVLTLLRSLVAGFFPTAGEEEISYSAFKVLLRDEQIESVVVSEEQITGTLKDGSVFRTVRVEDPALLRQLEANKVDTTGQVTSDGGVGALLGWILPVALMIGFWYFMLKRLRGGAGAGGGIFSVGKSKARVIQGEKTGVTFKDVGGAGEAVIELQEITEYLKNPWRFQRLGGKMPKGVLLVGSPGTGKTLLAKATAGEAGVFFYSISASEFIEMFVGVGASRVRDLFEQAKKNAPSIIFIDEIDAIGGRRAGAGATSVHEEREQTLNQLLAEMDGFESTRGVIVMAATNRPEVLDPALLRPGRFDRQITVDLPDLTGREEILRIHARDVTLAPEVDLAVIARITPGFSGADLANVINLAALSAARKEKRAVEPLDLDEAIERVVAGSERRTRAMNSSEKEIVAVHEAGHALVATLLPGTDPVHKVTIVPRGRALGYTWQRPAEDRYLISQSELAARLAVLLGGRAAEALTFNEVSTGATDDLARATDLARRMITEFGMSSALGPVHLAADSQAGYLNLTQGLDARVSPQTASAVDAETRRIVEEALSQAWELLDAHRPALERLARQLCELETVEGEEVKAILAQAAAEEERAAELAIAVA